METLDPAPGFYGKVTSNGDFVTRRLPHTFIEVWDTWLQHGIQSSREQLGKQWLETYLTSPIWRFALSHGACDGNAWAGVVMPSVDRVGRHFPLTISAGVPVDGKIFEWLRDGKCWYENLEDLALSSLADGFLLDRLENALRITPGLTTLLAVGKPKPPPAPAGNPRETAWCYSWGDLDQLEAAIPALTQEIAQNTLQGYSFWWTEGSQKIQPSLLVCKGLPSAAQYCAMLDGSWERAGWRLR